MSQSHLIFKCVDDASVLVDLHTGSGEPRVGEYIRFYSPTLYGLSPWFKVVCFTREYGTTAEHDTVVLTVWLTREAPPHAKDNNVAGEKLDAVLKEK